jgi:hypothetical protein
VPGIGFEAGTIAELDLEPGDHEIELFAASEAVPRRAGDRTDTALAAGTVSVGTDPMTIVAHLDQAGDPMISMFAEDVAPLEPGTGRLVVRNLMAGEEVAASVNGEVVVDSLAPGEEQVVPVEAGTMAFELLGSDGSVIEAHPAVGISDGELVSLSAIGDPSEGTAQVMIQTYAGLSSAPVAVPTGDSGLLDTGDGGSGLWIVYGLMVSLVVAGGVIAVRRQRSLS